MRGWMDGWTDGTEGTVQWLHGKATAALRAPPAHPTCPSILHHLHGYSHHFLDVVSYMAGVFHVRSVTQVIQPPGCRRAGRQAGTWACVMAVTLVMDLAPPLVACWPHLAHGPGYTGMGSAGI